MKVQVLSLDAKPVGEVELPAVFDTEFRPDVIKRAVLSAQAARIQPWGPDPMSGKRTSAETWGKGFGVHRIRRVKGKGPASGKGAFAPHAVGGRQAHPPRVEEVLTEKVNRKERHLAIRSAIAATKDKKLVTSRGHLIEGLPSLSIVVTNDLEAVKKTKQMREIMEKLGLGKDLDRVCESKRIRAGMGKLRGRRYRVSVGPLVVVGEDKGISLGTRNLKGVNIAKVNELNAELLAPGGMAGRLTVWTNSAIDKLAGGLYS